MSGKVMWRAVGMLGLAAAVAGCQEGNPFASRPANGAAPAAAAAPGAKSVKLVDRDVEAPGVFQVTDMALWDGRPSLGGVWVASPDAKDPERVIMRNPANGKFVIGALFRRERDNPGPTLQISSDAAEALGLLAGQPAKLSVTALRREEAPVSAPEADKPLLDTAETVADEAAPAAPKDAKPVAPGAVTIGTLPPKGGTAAAAPAPAPATPAKPAAKGAAQPASPAPAAAPAGGGLIQIGIFSVEANARRAADALAKAGVTADIRAETNQGKPFWSVTARGDAAVLAKIKSAGFKDAYLLKRG